MAILPQLRIGRQSNAWPSNIDMMVLLQFVQDYERRGIPFAVTRSSDTMVKLFKERRVCNQDHDPAAVKI